MSAVKARDIISIVVAVGAFALTALGKLPVDALLGILGGSLLPSPVERGLPAPSNTDSL